MTRDCQSHQDALLDIARGLPVDADARAALALHLPECDECRARMTQARTLTAGLRAVAHSLEGARPSSGLEGQLRQAFATLHPAAQSVERRAFGWRTWMSAAAAVVLVVAGLALAWQQMHKGPPIAEPAADAAAVSEFVPWPGAASLPAFESGQLVRTELPASVLPVLGLVPAGTVTDGRVLADVLIGQDGLARAVRLAKF